MIDGGAILRGCWCQLLKLSIQNERRGYSQFSDFPSIFSMRSAVLLSAFTYVAHTGLSMTLPSLSVSITRELLDQCRSARARFGSHQAWFAKGTRRLLRVQLITSGCADAISGVSQSLKQSRMLGRQFGAFGAATTTGRGRASRPPPLSVKYSP
jgi:hypothetical protein